MESLLFDPSQKTPLSLAFSLEEDTVRTSELSFPGSRSAKSPEQLIYREAEHQLLQQGNLGDTEIYARIKKASFGGWGGQPACLVHLGFDFCSKNGKSFFRFRSATINVEFEEIETAIASVEDEGKKADTVDSKTLDERLLIQDFYPRSIHGLIQHTLSTLNGNIHADPGGFGIGLSLGASKTSQREGKHMIQGTQITDWKVRWRISENEATKSGIYEQPEVAVVVRYVRGRGFAMRVGMEGTTFGGLPVKGRKVARIRFGGMEEGGGEDLGKVDLEGVTRMEARLLAREGPGGGETLRAEKEDVAGGEG